MKKIIFCFFVPLILFSCAKADFGSSDDSSKISVTIESEDGITELEVLEDSGNISRSVFTDSATNFVTTRTYLYNSSNDIRSVVVDTSDRGSYVVNYDEVTDSSQRSVMQESEEIPSKTRKIYKTYMTASRSVMESSEPDTVEYYYDDNGKLVAIIRIDDKNNIIVKGED